MFQVLLDVYSHHASVTLNNANRTTGFLIRFIDCICKIRKS